jgi:aminobenzoyl-glutamate utilization protein B
MATTAPYESPWHWVVVASGGMSIGHKGMLFASKSLTTMVDLFEKNNYEKT